MNRAVVTLLIVMAAQALGQTPPPVKQNDRFVRLNYAELTPKQKELAELYQSNARTLLGGSGPYDIDSQLMAAAESASIYVGIRSPEFTAAIMKAGSFLRGGAVPRKLHEIAILLTARAWNAQYEWWSHHQHAKAAGLSEDIIQAIAVGKRPAKMQPDEEAVYNFCTELRDTRQVSDKTFEAVKTQLGSEKAVVELMGAMAVYDLIAMYTNVDRFPVPHGIDPELKPLQ